VLREDTDDRWLDIVPGVPARTGDGRIVWTMDAGGARRLLVATPEELAEGSAEPVTPADLQVRDVLDVDSGTVLFSAWADEPTEIGLWTYGPGGLAQITAEAGVHHGRRTTWISLTSRGRRALSAHVAGLRALIDGIDASAAPPRA